MEAKEQTRANATLKVEVKTSIGLIEIEPIGRDLLDVHTRMPGDTYPWINLGFERTAGNEWELRGKSYFNGPGAEPKVMPAALLDELTTLGREWAAAHPEAFERAASAEFNGFVRYISDDELGGLATPLRSARASLERVLSGEPLERVLNGENEFARQASPVLRTQIENTIKLLRACDRQIAAAASAIKEAAGIAQSQEEA
jgi:hypothetical protein